MNNKKRHGDEEPNEEEKAAEEKLAAERKEKSDALKRTIGKCVVCMLDSAYVDDYSSEQRKDDPIVKPTNHPYCTPIREAQIRIEKLNERIRAVEHRTSELQRAAMDRAMPRTERARRAIGKLRTRAALVLHRFADRAERRDDDA
jgi:hypothetical protein